MIVHPHASLDGGARLVPVQSHAAFHSDRSCRDVEGKTIMTTKTPTLVTAHDRALASGNAAIRGSTNRTSPLPHPRPLSRLYTDYPLSVSPSSTAITAAATSLNTS